jgi:predicted MFS family arabinose efflux permease
LVSGILSFATAMGIGRFAYTPILPTMEQTAHLSVGLAGILASVNYAGYLIGALVAAAIPPGPVQRRVVISSLGAVILTTALMAETTDVVVWAGIRLLSGIASAGVFVLVGGMVLDFLRQEGRTSWSGWLFGGVGLGITISGLVVRAVDNAMGWRGDWITLAVVAALAVGVSWWWLPGSGRRAPEAPAPVSSIGGVATRATLTLLLSAYLLEGAGYIVTGTFLVAIVDRMHGLGDAGASVWVLAGLAAIPSAVLWIHLAGRLGYIPALVLAYIAQACGTALPAVGSGLTVAILAAVLFGATFIGISALTLTFAGLLAPDRSSTVIGLLTATFGVGQIVGPSLGALLAGHSHNFSLALLVAAAMIILGGALMLILQLRSAPDSAWGFHRGLS